MKSTNDAVRTLDRIEPVSPVTQEASESSLEGDGEQFKPLTAEEASRLRSRLGVLSPWRVVAAQAVAGGVVVAMAWLLFTAPEVAWSALYGAAAVVIPSALLARGMTRSHGGVAGAYAFSFMLWEFVKLGLSVAFLAAAPKVVPDLNWPAMLVAMVVCMKMNWLALLWRGRVTTSQS